MESERSLRKTRRDRIKESDVRGDKLRTKMPKIEIAQNKKVSGADDFLLSDFGDN